MRSCASLAAATSFKPFNASASSTDTARVSFINGVEPRHDVEFSRFRVLGGVHLPNLVFIRRYPIHSLVSSSSSLEPQVGLEFAEEDDQPQMQLQLLHVPGSSWMVHIRLQLERECSFGEQFLVVGDHPTLGQWNPLSAAPMVWSDGHVWTAELDLPVDELIQFKLILKKASGKILWQPGPNRILQTWKTSNIIRVFGDWEIAAVQHVTEEHDTDCQYGESDEMGQLRKHNGKLKPLNDGYNGEVASFNDQAMSMVAENITYHTVEDGGYRSKKFPVERTVEISGNVVAKDVISRTVKDEIAVPNKGLRRRKNIIDINGETHPVLVPGLTPCITVAAEDVTAQEEAAEVNLNASSKKYAKPKLDQRQEEEEEESERYKKEVMTELIFNKSHAQIQHPNKAGFGNSDQPHQGLQLAYLKDWNNKENGILHSRIKWGQENVRVLLNNLGFGFIFRAMK